MMSYHRVCRKINFYGFRSLYYEKSPFEYAEQFGWNSIENTGPNDDLYWIS